MSGVSEKHREAARVIALGAASQVDNNDDARAVETLVSGLVATALAKAEHEGMSAWRPIASAPRDGTRILIYYAAPGATAKQAWSANERGHFVRLARWDDDKWRLDMAGHFRLDATHWMPIPPASPATLSKPLRPHCLRPDACASGTREHCYQCRKQMAESEVAA